MTKFVEPVSKICNDCPFRRKSMPGWLGASSPEGFIDCMQRDEPLPCHQTINYEDPHWLAKWMRQRDTGKICAGSLVFMANKLQRPHTPGFPTLPRDLEKVFTNSIEFVRHHREAGVHSWNDDDMDEGAQLHHVIVTRAAESMKQPIINFKNRKTKHMPKKTQTKKVKTKDAETELIEDAVREIEDAIEALTALKIPVKKYVDALEDVSTYVDAALEAARDDIKRAERTNGGGA